MLFGLSCLFAVPSLACAVVYAACEAPCPVFLLLSSSTRRTLCLLHNQTLSLLHSWQFSFPILRFPAPPCLFLSLFVSLFFTVRALFFLRFPIICEWFLLTCRASTPFRKGSIREARRQKSNSLLLETDPCELTVSRIGQGSVFPAPSLALRLSLACFFSLFSLARATLSLLFLSHYVFSELLPECHTPEPLWIVNSA